MSPAPQHPRSERAHDLLIETVDLARVADYIDWAEKVVAGCRGLNASLERAFDAAVTDARAAIAKSAA